MKKGLVIGTIIVLMMAALPGLVSGAQGDMHGSQGCECEGIGHFNYSSGTVDGYFVDFSIDPKSGEISNYEVNGTLVFEKVSYENSTNGEVNFAGAALWYYGIGAQLDWNTSWNMSFNDGKFKPNYMWRFLSSHDTPAGVLHIVVYGEDTITYVLGDGITAEKSSNRTITLSGAVNGVLIFSGDASVSGNVIKVKLGTKNYYFGDRMFRGGSVIFVRTSAWHFEEKLRKRIMNAIAEGKVGGEITIGSKGEAFVNYTYGFHARVEMKERNRMRIAVESENHEGKVVMMNIEKKELQYDANHKIVVKLDGKEIRVTNENDVFGESSEGKYAVVDNGNYVTVMVYVPHFSEHTLEVESQETSPIESVMSNPVSLGAIIAIVLVVIVAAVVIIKRR